MAKSTKKKETVKKITPLMAQYNGIKAKYPDALLLFRVGDFYETFGEDAIKASKVLGIVLTNRNNGGSKLELAGFPHHSVDTYLPKLVRAGYRVAICDQLENPKQTKQIVKRGVTELVTPGVAFNEQILEHKSNNFLASVTKEGKVLGVSFLDVSTGEFLVSQGNKQHVQKLLQSFLPSEVLFQKYKDKELLEELDKDLNTFGLEDWVYTYDFGLEKLTSHFETKNLKGFGVEGLNAGIIAAGAILHYLSETQHSKIKHITSISRVEEDRYVWLDPFTIRNLELLQSPHKDAVTLIDILDETMSPMGGRMLKRWTVLPLKDEKRINERLEVVDFLQKDEVFLESVRSHIRTLGDLERLISKVAAGRITPREVNYLKNGLDAIVPIKELCASSKNKVLQKIADQLNTCDLIREKIEKELQSEAPALLSKGNVIKTGVSEELDELKAISNSGKDYLIKLQQREIEKTGISSLKIGFNNVFGYFLEVRNTYKDKAPAEWIRKQTLVSSERYVTEELKEYENKILGAEEKIQTIEATLFQELVLDLSSYTSPIQANANILAQVDCLSGFAYLAIKNKYTRPEVNDSLVLDIKEGRHPVIEKRLPIGEEYISNDVYLDTEEQQIIIITGPNMAGKSALLRQTALIVIMAQMGCFVPAISASIGLVDKVFTRVGASDNISSGESTFMVEMTETASILNNISDRSLVLLDEIGRGTSTYDGISIAWAITEYLHEKPSRAKTLFATHYHELNEMSTSFKRIKNYNVSVKEIQNKIIFLRKLISGGSEHSFGIHVAKIAGVPQVVVNRANEVLKQLESKTMKRSVVKSSNNVDFEKSKSDDVQLSFFQLDDPVLVQIRDEIKNLEINNLTPVEALMKLNEIKKLSGV